MSQATLKARQEASARVRQRMLEALIGYDPCRDLRIADVQFIANWAQTIAFDAMADVEAEGAA